MHNFLRVKTSAFHAQIVLLAFLCVVQTADAMKRPYKYTEQEVKRLSCPPAGELLHRVIEELKLSVEDKCYWVNLLISHDKKFNSENNPINKSRQSDGATPLHIAAEQFRYGQIVAQLLDAGADPFKINNAGLTAIACSMAIGCTENLGIFLKYLQKHSVNNPQSAHNYGAWIYNVQLRIKDRAPKEKSKRYNLRERRKVTARAKVNPNKKW
jgi:ankyrin repeat protein